MLQLTRCFKYDHVIPAARGGSSTAGDLRLRCRTHDPYTAEQSFGAGFTRERRTAAHGRGHPHASR